MSTVFGQRKSCNTNAWSLVPRSIMLPLPRMMAARNAGEHVRSAHVDTGAKDSLARLVLQTGKHLPHDTLDHPRRRHRGEGCPCPLSWEAAVKTRLRARGRSGPSVREVDGGIRSFADDVKHRRAQERAVSV